jgi:hypothetical protein
VWARCSDCVIHKLDALAWGEFGVLLRAAVGWREALDLGLQVRLEEIPADEYIALAILTEQRNASVQHNQSGDHGRSGDGQPGDWLR